MLNCYKCPKSPSLADWSQDSDLLEPPRWGSPTLIKSPSLLNTGLFYGATSLKKELLNTYIRAHTHIYSPHKRIFVVVFLRLGTKLRSKISQWTLPAFIFKDRERQNEKGASFISFPSPSQPKIKTLILRMEQGWKRSRKLGLVYLLALSGTIVAQQLFLILWKPCLQGEWSVWRRRQREWGVTSNIFCTSRKRAVVSQKEQRSYFWVAVVRNWFYPNTVEVAQ